ncbi:MAG TPA: DUF1554 domain-containing protein, partial [Myxococcota bacterium]|nr:DUF1554 domain-containing protein [Myxococcota bacterium]
AFSGIAVPDVSVINDDNDTAGIYRWENAIYTTEAGGTDQVRYTLNSKPVANVNCTIEDDTDFDEIRVGATGVATMTFTPDTWGFIQSETVTGLPDGTANDLGSAHVRIHCTSADPKYNNQAVHTEAYNIDTTTAKRLFITAAAYTSTQVAPTAADALCESVEPVAGTWKALIASAAAANRREACLTAGCNWVLLPNTIYYWHDREGVLGVTNGSAVFTSLIDGVPVSVAAGGWWTGMDAGMSTLNTCQGWTSTSAAVSGTNGGQYQRGNMMATFSAFSAECNRTFPIVCVEQ